jgi:hypothetical protein
VRQPIRPSSLWGQALPGNISSAVIASISHSSIMTTVLPISQLFNQSIALGQSLLIVYGGSLVTWEGRW